MQLTGVMIGETDRGAVGVAVLVATLRRGRGDRGGRASTAGGLGVKGRSYFRSRRWKQPK